MKKVLVIVGLLISVIANCQVSPIFIKPSNPYGTRSNRAEVDSTLYFPTGCGVPTDSSFLFSMQNNGRAEKPHMWAFYGDSCGGHVWAWNPKLQAWHAIDSSTGGGGTADTTVLATIWRLYNTIDSLAAANNGTYLKKTDSVTATAYATNGHLYKVIDSLKNIFDVRYMRNFGGVPGWLKGTLASRPSAGSEPDGTHYTAIDSATVYYDSAQIKWKQISGGVNGSTLPFEPFSGVYTTDWGTVENKVYFFGHSYTFGTNASDPSKRWTTLLTTAMNVQEHNFGVAGKTMMLQNPKDYQGPQSMTETLSDIPNDAEDITAVFFDFGLNDMGNTAPDYTVTNFFNAYDTTLNNAINIKHIPRSKIALMGEEWIGSAGLTYYGTVTGNAAPTQVRAQQFVQAIVDLANKWGVKYIGNYYQTLDRDTTQISGTGSVHPNDAGYLSLANRVINKMNIVNVQNSIDSNLATHTYVQNYVQNYVAAKAARFLDFIVGDGGSKTPANESTVYTDDLLKNALQASMSINGLVASTKPRNSVYTSLNPTAGTITLHNAAFDDSTYYAITAFYTDTIPTTGNFDSLFIAAVTAAGATLTSAQKGYISTFFASLQTDNLWNKIQAGHLLFLGSANATKYNIKNSVDADASYRITWHGTGTFGSTGWQSDGSTGYGDLHFNPSTNASQNNLGLGAYVQGGGTGANIYIMGNYDGTSTTNDVYAQSGSVLMGGGVNSALSAINNQTISAPTRLVYVNRISSTQVKYYRDGSVISTESQTSATPYNGNLYLGCFNYNGSPMFFFGNTVSVSFITDGSLNDTDAANLNAAVNALLTSWGINI